MSAPIIRRAKPEDAQACAKICYEAFYKINTDHGFPPDMPSVEHVAGIMTMMLGHPGFYCVVAEADGRIVGSNCRSMRQDMTGYAEIHAGTRSLLTLATRRAVRWIRVRFLL